MVNKQVSILLFSLSLECAKMEVNKIRDSHKVHVNKIRDSHKVHT